MAKEVQEITSFTKGTVTTPSERDIAPESAAFSLNIDPLTEDGKLTGVPEDRLVASLSNNVPFEPLNYGLQWGASAIRIADLTQIPEATLDGDGSRIIFQGTKGVSEILKYTSAYFDSNQIKDTLLNIKEGIGDGESSGEITKQCTLFSVISLSEKREGLISSGDVISLSTETDVANIPKSIEWMLVTEVDHSAELITVERGHYNTDPLKYTSLSTNTNIYRLEGVLGWLNISGWQTNFKSNHIGQNPCIIYVANAGATSADNLTHDATNKTITITQNSLINNLGANDSIEDLVRNNDVIKIINASGGVATVNVDYVTDGIITYSSISGSLLTQVSGKYWIDCNKIANGNFRAYDTSADGKAPYGWTTTINPTGTATYDDAYAADTNSIGSPQLATTGGITGLKGNERDTSNSNYDSTESPFLILSNARDVATAVNSITLIDAITKLETDNRFRVSNPALFTEGDTLVLSHGIGVTLDNTSGNAYTGTDDNPYMQNHYTPGYVYEAINVASFTDNDTFEILIPTSIGGSGRAISMRLEDTSSAALTSAGANAFISVSNEDAAGANASDAQLALNIVAAINGCPDVQRVTYGTTTGTGDVETGVAGLSASVNSETSTKIDIWPLEGNAEEYVKIVKIDVSQDSGGDAQPGFITVTRAYHGNLQAHTAGTSIKRILRNQIKQTVGASSFDSVQEGKKYKLTWWVADVTKAWLGNNDYHLKPRLNFKLGCAGGYLLGGENWSSDKSIVGTNGEKAWLNSINYTTIKDSNKKTEKGDLGGSLYHTWAGNKNILDSTATGWVRGVITGRYQVGLNNLPKLASSISFVQDSGTTHNGNWTLGDASDENFSNIDGVSNYIETQPTALIHLSGAIHDRSIIGIPNTDGEQVYYAGMNAGLAGETVPASDGSAPKRRAYIEFEDFVGWNFSADAIYDISFFISSADGRFAQFNVAKDRNPSTNFKDGTYSAFVGAVVANAQIRYDNVNQATHRKFYIVAKDGADVGQYQTLPTQISSGGTWANNDSDSKAGSVLNDGTAWANSLKECIETVFNNYQGDGVTRFTVTQNGAALCIEDAIGGNISNTWTGEYTDTLGNVIVRNQNNSNYTWGLNQFSTGGKMHFKILINGKEPDESGWSTWQWANMTETGGRHRVDAGGSTDHRGFLKGDGLGFNLGGITEGGGYPAQGSDVNVVKEFLTCYHIGAGPTAAQGATNLDLAIEHANGQNGLITGNVASTDQLTLTRTDGIGSGIINTARFPDRLEDDSVTIFTEGGTPDVNFEFYTGVNNADTGSGKTILWHKCEFAFTLPDDKDISTLDVYFESDGEVWGGRDGGTIGSSVTDKYSSLIGIDSISLVESVEILPSLGMNTAITASANIKTPDDKELLIYHDSSNNNLSVLDDFGDPLEGSTNMFRNAEGIPYSVSTDITPVFTKNNREFHIGMGPKEESVWAGYLNHKQFGTDLSNEFVIDKSNIGSYDAQGAYSVDKICMSGFWLCNVESGSSEPTTTGGWKFYIPKTEHQLEIGDYLTVKGVSNKKGHENSGTHANQNDAMVYDATCMYMHDISTETDSNKEKKNIIGIYDEYIEVDDISDSITQIAGDQALQVYPPYYYGIARDSFAIYRINPDTGVITKGELPFKAQSICASYSQNEETIGNTGNSFQGGRVWIVDKLSGQIHKVNVAKTKWENFTKELTIDPEWCTWWSSTEENSSFDDVQVKDMPPTDRGHMSDIIETWGLKGSSNSLLNESDTRLWVQFYPNSGDSFGPLDNFIYCGNTHNLSNSSSSNSVNFCNRTIPLNHTGGGTQSDFDPHDRYGKTLIEVQGEGSSLGGANDSLVMKGALIAKTKLQSRDISPAFQRYCWFTPENINHNWVEGAPTEDNKKIQQIHFRRTNGTWDYDDQNTWKGGLGFRNYAENIGWDSDAPEFRMIRYGLIGLADNDYDGVIDGTGLPVSSAANINTGFENGKDCSSHAAAVLMQSDAKWIMNGQVAMAQPFNDVAQESRAYTMGVHHGGVGYDNSTFNKSVELFKPDAFFMVTSDIWKMEKGDCSSNHSDNNEANSKGAWIIPDNNSLGGKFSHASKSNASTDGELEHWSSSDFSDPDAVILKDRVHLFRTADKHNLTIGNNIVFNAPNNITDHTSAVFGAEGMHRNPEYASLCPVVGIVDDYHFLMNVTHNGNGTGTAGSDGDNCGGNTYVNTTGNETGIGESFLNWTVGATEWLLNHNSAASTENQYGRMFGGRVTTHDSKIEGGGMKFFSDGNMLGNFHFSPAKSYMSDTHYSKRQGVNVFQTSLLSFCHARMIRPLGDMDVSGVSDFNIDNSMSLFMPISPMQNKGLSVFNTGNTYVDSPRSVLCGTKLYLSQADGENTKLYSFDWDNIMPDTNRSTFEGVNYGDTTRPYSSHRSFGTYELGSRASGKRRLTTDMTHYNMHSNDNNHQSAKGRFRLAGPRANQSNDTAHEGDIADSANKQNFMIPGGFMIKAGSDIWNGTQFGYNDANQNTYGMAGISLGGDAADLQKNTSTSNYRPNGSLFSNWASNASSPYLRKGALNDLVAIWSYTSPQIEKKKYLIGPAGGGSINNPNFKGTWANGLGRSVARKVISSYATNGGYADAVNAGNSTTDTLVTYMNYTMHYMMDGGSVHSAFSNKGYDGNNMLVMNEHEHSNWDNTHGEIFLRTHYPLPGTPGVHHGESVTFIQSRDAALAPVRLDLEILPAYTGYYGAGVPAPVKVMGAPVSNQIKIWQGAPREDTNSNEAVLGEVTANGASDGYTNVTSNFASSFPGTKIRISGTDNYNGEYTLLTNSGTYGKIAGDYSGSSSEVEAGKLEILGSGLKANPVSIKGVQGISLQGRYINGYTLNSNATSTDFPQKTLGLTSGAEDSMMGISKSGDFKTGVIRRAYRRNFFGAYAGSNTGEATQTYYVPNNSISSRYWIANDSNYWMASEQADTAGSSLLLGPQGHLYETDVTFSITPGSAPGSGSANFTEFGDYRYKVSLVYDGYQEGPLSENEWDIGNIGTDVTYSSYNIALSVVNPNKRLTSICLYRKNDENDLFRLVDEVSTDSSKWASSDSTHTISIRDDGGLEATFESRAGYSEFLTNPYVNYGIGTSMSGYHFVGNCSHPQIKDASHMVFRSLPGQFDLFNWANDYLTLPSKPTAMANFAGRLYIFDELNTYKVNPQTLVIEDTFTGSGCVDMRSLIITDFGMFYCDRNNAYMHHGSSPEVISATIKKGGSTDISSFNISDLSWEKTAGNLSSMNPLVAFDNKRNSVLFFVEKQGDELVNHSRYYCWAYSVMLSRWDLWEVSTGDDGAGVFDSSKVISPSSVITTTKGKTFITMGDFIVDFLGGTNTKPWQFLSKKLTVGHNSQKKVWKNIKFIGNDDDVTVSVGDPKGSISIAIDDSVIESSDRTFTKDSPDGKVTIKGTSKTGRYLQFLLTQMESPLDAVGIVFRRKGIK